MDLIRICRVEVSWASTYDVSSGEGCECVGVFMSKGDSGGWREGMSYYG